MSGRLKASFTVFDCFEGKIGCLNDLAACLKSPPALADVWLQAVIRMKTPLLWKELKAKYWEALLRIKSEAELQLLKNEHLLDWPDLLFGKQGLDTGLATYECWD